MTVIEFFDPSTQHPFSLAMATVEVDKAQNAPAASASTVEHTGDGSLLETMQKAAKQGVLFSVLCPHIKF